MIASIQGQVAATFVDHLIVNVGGVGLYVNVPHPAIQRIKGHEVFLYTVLIVREDGLSLYGFDNTSDRELFEALIKVNGVGPRLALSILSTLSTDNLRSAVMNDRSDILTRVPGIGKKTAQKIVLELKDKMPSGLDAVPLGIFEDVNSDVIETLIALGYSIVEAQAAVQSLPADAPDNIEERVRLALQYFT